MLIAAFDLVPLSWLGVAIDLTVLALGGSLVLRWSRSPGWDRSRIATLTFGGLLARTLIGFLAPLEVVPSVVELRDGGPGVMVRRSRA